MAGYLLDTSHLSAAVRTRSAVRSRIQDARSRGIRFGTCIPVLYELEVGIHQVQNPGLYRKALARFLAQATLWPLDLATAQVYGALYLDLRRRGRVLSQVDLMLGALARRFELTLLTTDRDFEAVPDLRVENWLNS
jgi:tRNA(fMet)-specific endonuclease VapC